MLLLLFAFIKFALRPPIEKETPKGFGLTIFKETTINYNVRRERKNIGIYVGWKVLRHKFVTPGVKYVPAAALPESFVFA